MQGALGSAFPDFEAALKSKPVTSIRLNPKKPIAQFDALTPVPWHPNGKYLDERPLFASDPLIFSGGYYVQEASSMFLYQALSQQLDLSQPLKVLDLCAAPGGKSTLIASLLSAESLLVSNEYIGKRTLPLIENLLRWGTPNVLVTHEPAEHFAAFQSFFDCLVIDAPCSGEGMFRKDRKAVEQWSENLIKGCAYTQREILNQVITCLKPGGLLVFSTCTFTEEENEANMRLLLDSGEFEAVELSVPAQWEVTVKEVEQGGKTSKGYQFLPHKTRGEGFFMSCFRKTHHEYSHSGISINKKKIKLDFVSKKLRPLLDGWLSEPEKYDYVKFGENVHAIPYSCIAEISMLLGKLHGKLAGIPMGQLQKDQLIPGHALALSQAVNRQLPSVELTYEEAMNYLRKQEIKPDTGNYKGWALVTYQQLPLGWVKVLPNRINNHLPKEWRLRKEFDSEGFEF